MIGSYQGTNIFQNVYLTSSVISVICLRGGLIKKDWQNTERKGNNLQKRKNKTKQIIWKRKPSENREVMTHVCTFPPFCGFMSIFMLNEQENFLKIIGLFFEVTKSCGI